MSMMRWSERIREKIAFLKRQATLSQQLGVRTMQMLGLLPTLSALCARARFTANGSAAWAGDAMNEPLRSASFSTTATGSYGIGGSYGHRILRSLRSTSWCTES